MAPIQVSTTDDWTESDPADGECSLREALIAARDKVPVDGCQGGNTNVTLFGPPLDVIHLPAGQYDLVHGSLILDTNAVIRGDGQGVSHLIGNGEGPVVVGAVVTGSRRPDTRGVLGALFPGLESLSISGGTAAQGGGLFNLGLLKVRNVALLNNRAQQGGGIFNSGGDSGSEPADLLLLESVIANNFAEPLTGLRGTLEGSRFQGGGLFNEGLLEVVGTTFRNNQARSIDDLFASAQAEGGGAYLAGFVRVEESTFEGNVAVVRSLISDTFARGGAIYARGTEHSLDNLTISENQASGIEDSQGVGGGVFAEPPECGELRGICSGPTALIEFATVFGNEASGFGGGLVGSASVGRSIVLQNQAPSGPNCGTSSGISSSGANLYLATEADCPSGAGDQNVTPPTIHLQALADNGGPVKTHRLLPASPAINTGGNGTRGTIATCDRFDGRGFDRYLGGACDLGAYEVLETAYVFFTEPSSTVPGTSTSLEMLVENAGYFSLTVDIESMLGPNLTNCEWTCAASSFGESDPATGAAVCTPGPSTGEITESGLVLPGASRLTYSLQCDLSPAAPDVVDLQAIVLVTEGFDPVPEDNSSSSSFETTPEANLTIISSATTSPEFGGTWSVSFDVSNSGPSAAFGTLVTLEQLQNLTLETVDCRSGTVALPGALCEFDRLDPGANEPIEITFALSGDPGQQASLTALVESSASDLFPDGNQSTVSVEIVRTALFSDGFESGGTDAWSRSVPAAP